MKWLRSQRGDTIVEVLIAITVVAAVLGASYTVVNRTMVNSRQAQEHAEALQVANKQIEFLSTLTSDPVTANGLYDGAPRYMCINPTTGAVVDQNLSSPSDAEESYAPACRNLGSVNYRVAVECLNGTAQCAGVAAGNKHFKVYVTWPSVTGNGNDQVTLVYRPYRP